MSDYGDWKYGLITEDQYISACYLDEYQSDYGEDNDDEEKDETDE